MTFFSAKRKHTAGRTRQVPGIRDGRNVTITGMG